MKYFIGIDPGIGGGICVMGDNSKIFYLDAMPVIKVGTKNKLDLPKIKMLIDNPENKIVAIERQQAYPKQGVVTCFTIGMGFGQLEGLCAGCKLAYEIVGPKEWQKVMYQGLPKGKPKDHSVLMAQRLFPNTSFTKNSRCTNIHDGMTDAALIAEYARRRFK